MVRYRFGPWDPAYYALLGALIGRGLVEVVPYNRGLGYKTTGCGSELAASLQSEPAWQQLAASAAVLYRHFNQSGASLKKFVYDTFPEVGAASWTEEL
jgi:hypothetical protein